MCRLVFTTGAMGLRSSEQQRSTAPWQALLFLWVAGGSFLKKPVKGIPFCCSAGSRARAALCKRKAIAEICAFLINNPLSLRLPAFIVGAPVVKAAVQAAVQVSVTARAGVGSAEPAAGINGIVTAVAAGHGKSSPANVLQVYICH
jgi:hypothetical protein